MKEKTDEVIAMTNRIIGMLDRDDLVKSMAALKELIELCGDPPVRREVTATSYNGSLRTEKEIRSRMGTLVEINAEVAKLNEYTGLNSRRNDVIRAFLWMLGESDFINLDSDIGFRS